METLITGFANWLIQTHSIEMAGWQWLFAVPLAILILAALFVVLLNLVLSNLPIWH